MFYIVVPLLALFIGLTADSPQKIKFGVGLHLVILILGILLWQKENDFVGIYASSFWTFVLIILFESVLGFMVGWWAKSFERFVASPQPERDAAMPVDQDETYPHHHP